MNRTKRIKTILDKNIIDFSINILDNSNSHKGHNNFDGNGETHIIIELKKNSNYKYNIDRLEIHRKINLLLENEFKMGLHSLQIKII